MWKQKGEEYRLFGGGGWVWTSGLQLRKRKHPGDRKDTFMNKKQKLMNTTDNIIRLKEAKRKEATKKETDKAKATTGKVTSRDNTPTTVQTVSMCTSDVAVSRAATRTVTLASSATQSSGVVKGKVQTSSPNLLSSVTVMSTCIATNSGTSTITSCAVPNTVPVTTIDQQSSLFVKPMAQTFLSSSSTLGSLSTSAKLALSPATGKGISTELESVSMSPSPMMLSSGQMSSRVAPTLSDPVVVEISSNNLSSGSNSSNVTLSSALQNSSGTSLMSSRNLLATEMPSTEDSTVNASSVSLISSVIRPLVTSSSTSLPSTASPSVSQVSLSASSCLPLAASPVRIPSSTAVLSSDSVLASSAKTNGANVTSLSSAVFGKTVPSISASPSAIHGAPVLSLATTLTPLPSAALSLSGDVRIASPSAKPFCEASTLDDLNIVTSLSSSAGNLSIIPCTSSVHATCTDSVTSLASIETGSSSPSWLPLSSAVESSQPAQGVVSTVSSTIKVGASHEALFAEDQALSATDSTSSAHGTIQPGTHPKPNSASGVFVNPASPKPDSSATPPSLVVSTETSSSPSVEDPVMCQCSPSIESAHESVSAVASDVTQIAKDQHEISETPDLIAPENKMNGTACNHVGEISGETNSGGKVVTKALASSENHLGKESENPVAENTSTVSYLTDSSETKYNGDWIEIAKEKSAQASVHCQDESVVEGPLDKKGSVVLVTNKSDMITAKSQGEKGLESKYPEEIGEEKKNLLNVFTSDSSEGLSEDGLVQRLEKCEQSNVTLSTCHQTNLNEPCTVVHKSGAFDSCHEKIVNNCKEFQSGDDSSFLVQKEPDPFERNNLLSDSKVSKSIDVHHSAITLDGSGKQRESLDESTKEFSESECQVPGTKIIDVAHDKTTSGTTDISSSESLLGSQANLSENLDDQGQGNSLQCGKSKIGTLGNCDKESVGMNGEGIPLLNTSEEPQVIEVEDSSAKRLSTAGETDRALYPVVVPSAGDCEGQNTSVTTQEATGRREETANVSIWVENTEVPECKTSQGCIQNPIVFKLDTDTNALTEPSKDVLSLNSKETTSCSTDVHLPGHVTGESDSKLLNNSMEISTSTSLQTSALSTIPAAACALSASIEGVEQNQQDSEETIDVDVISVSPTESTGLSTTTSSTVTEVESQLLQTLPSTPGTRSSGTLSEVTGATVSVEEADSKRAQVTSTVITTFPSSVTITTVTGTVSVTAVQSTASSPKVTSVTGTYSPLLRQFGIQQQSSTVTSARSPNINTTSSGKMPNSVATACECPTVGPLSGTITSPAMLASSVKSPPVGGSHPGVSVVVSGASSSSSQMTGPSPKTFVIGGAPWASAMQAVTVKGSVMSIPKTGTPVAVAKAVTVGGVTPQGASVTPRPPVQQTQYIAIGPKPILPSPRPPVQNTVLRINTQPVAAVQSNLAPVNSIAALVASIPTSTTTVGPSQLIRLVTPDGKSFTIQGSQLAALAQQAAASPMSLAVPKTITVLPAQAPGAAIQQKAGATIHKTVAIKTPGSAVTVQRPQQHVAQVKPGLAIKPPQTAKPLVQEKHPSLQPIVRDPSALLKGRLAKWPLRHCIKSLFKLQKHELRKLARKAGMKEVVGFLYSSRATGVNWPAGIPRPSFKVAWRFRTQSLKTLAGAGLQLMILHACLKWDEINVRPPRGTANTIYTSSG